MSEQLQSSLTMSQMLDTESLRATFNEQFDDQKSHDLVVKKLAGDASTREYYRIHSPKTGKSWVLQKSEIFSDSASSTHPFLAAQKIFSVLKIPVPQVLGVAPHLGWILLDDLGDETLQTQKSYDNYKGAIKIISSLALKADPLDLKLKDKTAHAPHWYWAFDFEKLNFEMNFTAQHLVTDFLKLDSKKFLASTQVNTKYLVDCPRFFCHRDYHSRNIMVQPATQALSVIDFQDARMGPLSYDLVSLLWDPYVPLDQDWKDKLISVWRQELINGTQEPQFSRIKKALEPGTSHQTTRWKIELKRMIIQRMLKAAGSYASFFVKKKREDYLPSLFPALVSSIEALGELKTEHPAAWTPEDGELLTQTEFILKALPDSLKKR